MGVLNLDPVAGAETRCRSSREGWFPRTVSGTDPLLRDRPSPPRFGRCSAFTYTVRRLSRIAQFSPLMLEASPMRLAFAAGQVCLATHLGVTLGKRSNIPPAVPHCCFPAASASPRLTFALL